MGDSSSKRPFWMHQLVEYILGGALVASGLQSPTPVVPAVVGGGVLLYAACTKSSIAAFRLIPRRVHKVGDPLVVAAQLVAAVQPWVSVDNGTRVIMVGVAVVHLFVWWQSRYDEKVKAVAAPRSGDRATDIGRTAGRLVGGGVKMARSARAKRSGN